MKREKIKRLAAGLACCLLLTACPPSGGHLSPLAQDGAALETRQFQNDTLSITREQISVRARGNWSAGDSQTSFNLEIQNARAEAVQIAFDNCELINRDNRETLSLRTVNEDGVNALLAPGSRTVTIAGGQTKRYYLSFFIKPMDGRSSVTRDVLGQSVSLRVPVSFGAETAAPVDFLFDFKYVEYRY
jgi:hypothetical protein